MPPGVGGLTKILFFPSYLGGGFGHIGRCLALAEAWTRRGGTAAFAVNGPHLSQIARAGYEIYTLTTPRMPVLRSSSTAYVRFPNMDYQIVRDGFDHPRVVERALAEAIQIADQARPDVLVGDGWPLARLVAHQAGLPLVQIVKSVVHPHPERLTWWEDPPADSILPDAGPVFNPVLARIGLPAITHAEELLAGDLMILPSIPPLDPMRPLPADTYYVGPIIRQLAAPTQLPTWLASLSKTQPIIYVTVGGAASNSGSAAFFQMVGAALGGGNYQVIVSTGGQDAPPGADMLPPNIHLKRWVPGPEMIAHSDVVVFHGGYTRMEILRQGLPSVVIPFHSEQEYYGRLMADARVALLVHYSQAPYHRFLARWRGGGWLRSRCYTWHIRPAPTLQPQTLRAAVEQTLSEPALRSNAQAMQSLLATYGGSEQALDLMETHLAPL
jgi:UDP:flavonoid glycosyltransferase YjiC (YdhE family)